jgi:hypothetical protein
MNCGIETRNGIPAAGLSRACSESRQEAGTHLRSRTQRSQCVAGISPAVPQRGFCRQRLFKLNLTRERRWVGQAPGTQPPTEGRRRFSGSPSTAGGTGAPHPPLPSAHTGPLPPGDVVFAKKHGEVGYIVD